MKKLNEGSPELIEDASFEKALDRWMIKAQKIVDNAKINQLPNTTRPKLTKTEGIKYIKIVETRNGKHVGAFCFINKTNGDVLKAASWKKPAKHARGNIFTNEVGVNEYGGLYLR